MKFCKISGTVGNGDTFRWHCDQDTYKAIGRQLLLMPVRIPWARTSFHENQQPFRVFAACANARQDPDELASHVFDAFREWDVTGPIHIESIEESTFGECFEDNWASFKIRKFEQFFSAHEFHMLVRETNVVSEQTVRLDQQPQLARSPYRNAVSQELARIERSRSSNDRPYAKSTPAPIVKQPFLPAHYLIEGMNAHDYDTALDTLLDSLAKAGRIPSGEVVTIDLDRIRDTALKCQTFEYFLRCMNDALIESMEGMALVIRYGMFDSGGDFRENAYRALTNLLDALRRHPHSVQTFLIVPEKAEDLKYRIQSHCAVPWVEIARDAPPSVRNMDKSQTLAILENKAIDAGIEPDPQLGTLLEERLEDLSFDDLDDLFNEWRHAKITHEQFPSYEEILHRSRDRKTHLGETALEQLDSLIGLASVKEQLHNIILRVRMNRELARAGLPERPFTMHMAFLGAPGTGKTEVAHRYAEILREQHVLKEGRLVVRAGSDIFDVDKAFEAARGSVLFVDEAYGLAGKPGMIESLIANMENHREEVVVILAGYEEQMERLSQTNPGFRSRLGFCLHFPDYSESEKLEIFQLMARRAHLILPDETTTRVRDVLARGGKRDDEGNARFVRKLFEDACGRQESRLAREEPSTGYTQEMLQTLLPDDIGAPTVQEAISAREELLELVGLESVKSIISSHLDLMKVQKARRDSGIPSSFIPLHLAFKGNPGTGKTEVARLIGRILKEEGVLSVGDFYECGRQDLIAPFAGGTAPRIEALFKRAKGSVIFIDEAYSLNDGHQGSYGEEAITVIIDQMEKLREDVVVIFAGYTEEIDGLFAANPGFASRVRTHVEFPDYTADELVNVLELMARKQNLDLAPAAKDKVHGIFARAVTRQNFGNARFARNLLEESLIAQSTRLVTEAFQEGTDLSTLAPERLVVLSADDFTEDWVCSDHALRPIGFLST